MKLVLEFNVGILYQSMDHFLVESGQTSIFLEKKMKKMLDKKYFKNIYRHDLSKHQKVFYSVAVIFQLEIEN